MIKLFFILSLLTSIAYMREIGLDPFFQETSNPVAELYAVKNNSDPRDFLASLSKRAKAIVEGPYVEIQTFYAYKNTMDHLVAAEFEFPQIETDISHKVEIRYQDTSRIIFDEANSPKKEYDKENPYTNERFLYKEIRAGNVPAQDTVEVIFTVMRPLKINMNQFYELSISPFYIPRFRTLSSSSFYGNYNLQVELRSERPFSILVNPADHLQPELSNHTDPLSGVPLIYKAFYNATIRGSLFSQDFKIYFASSDFNAPQTIMATHSFNPHDHAFMFSLIPDMMYFPSQSFRFDNDKSFRKDVPPILQHLDDPKNFLKLKNLTVRSDLHYFSDGYLFMIDRSHSMKGPQLQNLKKTLNKFLSNLSKSASFYSILSFGNSSQFHWKRPGDDDPYKIHEDTEEIMKWIETMEADMGEKDLLGALKYAFEEFEWTELPKNVIILTDGEIPNMDEIIRLVQAKSHSQRICAMGVDGDGEDVRKIAEAGGCPTLRQWWGGSDERVLNVLEATLTPPGFNLAYEITCENEQNETVYQEEGGSDGISKDKAFIKWVTLSNIPNLRSCKAKIFYYSKHRCFSSSEEVEIFRSEKAQLTDTWHKVADYVKLYEPQVEESKRELMVNSMQEEDNQILSDMGSFEGEELLNNDDLQHQGSRYEIYKAQFHNLHCYDKKTPRLSVMMFSSSQFSSRAREKENEPIFSFKIICIASVFTILFVAGLFIML